jgi:hypothetical protein
MLDVGQTPKHLAVTRLDAMVSKRKKKKEDSG